MKRDSNHRIELKSKREIGLMRQAGLAVWKAHRIAGEMMQPGMSTARIDAAVEAHFDQLGAEPLFKNYPNSIRSKPSFPAVTCMSVNDAVVHGIPDGRPLEDGDIVSIDTGCRLNGWCGDAALTHPIGKVDPEIQRLLDVTKGVLDLSIELLAHKSHWSQIADQMAQYVADHKFFYRRVFLLAMGIGREMHEESPGYPIFRGRSLSGSNDFAIRPGLVIAIEPMVNMGTKSVKMLRDQWTQVTADGLASASFLSTRLPSQNRGQ